MHLETTHGVSNTMSQVSPNNYLSGPRITSYHHLLHITKIKLKHLLKWCGLGQGEEEHRLLSKLAKAIW